MPLRSVSAQRKTLTSPWAWMRDSVGLAGLRLASPGSWDARADLDVDVQPVAGNVLFEDLADCLGVAAQFTGHGRAHQFSHHRQEAGRPGPGTPVHVQGAGENKYLAPIDAAADSGPCGAFVLGLRLGGLQPGQRGMILQQGRVTRGRVRRTVSPIFMRSFLATEGHDRAGLRIRGAVRWAMYFWKRLEFSESLSLSSSNASKGGCLKSPKFRVEEKLAFHEHLIERPGQQTRCPCRTGTCCRFSVLPHLRTRREDDAASHAQEQLEPFQFGETLVEPLQVLARRPTSAEEQRVIAQQIVFISMSVAVLFHGAELRRALLGGLDDRMGRLLGLPWVEAGIQGEVHVIRGPVEAVAWRDCRSPAAP